MQFARVFNRNSCGLWIATLVFASMPSILRPASKAPASIQTLGRVRETGTLKLGYFPEARPFSYQNEMGKPDGYALALCQKIADDVKEQLGLPTLAIDFVSVTTADRFDAVQQGKIDLLCAPSVETVDRRKQVSFATPIFPGGLGALIRADAPAQIKDVLSGHQPPYRPQWRASMGLALQKRTFSAVKGTTGINWLSGKIAEFQINAKVVPVENEEAGVERVLDRSSDVFFGERSMLLDTKHRSSSSNDMIVLDRLFTYEPFAFALARSDEDFRLLVDTSLSRLSRSGETQRLYRKFFGEPDQNTLNFFRLNTVVQ
ncbi:MAG TPA: amino acid ABC transporter substrate-binding protein [Terriglobales bacterium]|jgi:ABC-type amino acid transport substrate-binding protein